MPTVTPADALIKAADNFVDIITGQLPKNSVTADAVEQLLEICKLQAKKATCEARAQRVLRENAQAQRVAEEKSSTTPSQAFPQVPIPIISKDNDSPPAENTCQQCQVRTLTQNYLFHMMEIPGHQAPFTPAQAALPKYPLQFLCDFAYAVLDDDTGDLLEYRHLIKHLKYKDTWSQ